MFQSVGLPHGFCFLWNPQLLWLHILSDSLIAFAYFLIPVVLVFVLRKRRDVPFNGVFFCFAAFIVACGADPRDGGGDALVSPSTGSVALMKAVTAAISIATLVVLVRISPCILAIPHHLADRRFRELIENAPDAILQVDAQGAIVIANRTTGDMLGYSREELLGMRVEQLIPLDRRGSHRAHRKEFMKAGVTRAMGEGMGDLHARRKDGTELSVEIALSPVTGDTERYVTAIIRDVTERKRIEHDLARAHHIVQSVLESTTMSVIAVDADWRIDYVNHTAEALFNRAAGVIGLSLWDALPGQMPATRSALEKVMRTKVPAVFEAEYEPLRLALRIKAHPWENGGITVFISDVSEQKRMERRLESANRRAEAVLNNTSVCVYAVDKRLEVHLRQ